MPIEWISLERREEKFEWFICTAKKNLFVRFSEFRRETIRNCIKKIIIQTFHFYLIANGCEYNFLIFPFFSCVHNHLQLGTIQQCLNRHVALLQLGISTSTFFHIVILLFVNCREQLSGDKLHIAYASSSSFSSLFLFFNERTKEIACSKVEPQFITWKNWHICLVFSVQCSIRTGTQRHVLFIKFCCCVFISVIKDSLMVPLFAHYFYYLYR